MLEQEESKLIDQGFSDYIDGNESYSSRYLMGVMYANNVINLNHLNGNEGFLSDVGNKLKQFFSWLWKQFKNIIGFLFGGGHKEFEIKLLTGEEAIEAAAKKYKLKSDSSKKVSTQLKNIVNNLESKINSYCNSLKDVISEINRNTDAGKAVHNFVYSSPEKVKEDWEEHKKKLDSLINEIENSTDVNGFGKPIVRFGKKYHEYCRAFYNGVPKHKSGVVKNDNELIDENTYIGHLNRDMEEVSDKQKDNAAKLVQKVSNVAMFVLNYNNTGMASYSSIVMNLNANRYWEGKK